MAREGLHAWVFGGWAEELLGLIGPRRHSDLDLLLPAKSFSALDQFIDKHGVQDIAEKHFPHKRTFEGDSVRVEVFLVHRTPMATTQGFGAPRRAGGRPIC